MTGKRLLQCNTKNWFICEAFMHFRNARGKKRGCDETDLKVASRRVRHDKEWKKEVNNE